ncbi:hypothetical protein AF72_08620 [Xylella taiwanensis]|uniref:Uncharacterized protein n=1 Tax=Xylella taiwanensis TaxID=1444770 RepID=Z9JJ19_9GAMM|nr:hypothetical protein AB672_08505 [Xylella taiwanensis]EWS77831.1 hypothetical protein AF72_08620 [Xylella taiwanensis]
MLVLRTKTGFMAAYIFNGDLTWEANGPHLKVSGQVEYFFFENAIYASFCVSDPNPVLSVEVPQ